MGSSMWIAPSGGRRRYANGAASAGEIEVKCFGGADRFSRDINKREAGSVGNQNLTIDRQFLASEGLSLKVSDVGGMRGRRIFSIWIPAMYF